MKPRGQRKETSLAVKIETNVWQGVSVMTAEHHQNYNEIKPFILKNILCSFEFKIQRKVYRECVLYGDPDYVAKHVLQSQLMTDSLASIIEAPKTCLLFSYSFQLLIHLSFR